MNSLISGYSDSNLLTKRLQIDRAYLGLPSLRLKLTEVIGDVIRNVDLPVGPLAPHAALAGAGVSVLLSLVVNGDVSTSQDGIIVGMD